jgi:hypothetical protein
MENHREALERGEELGKEGNLRRGWKLSALMLALCRDQNTWGGTAGISWKIK